MREVLKMNKSLYIDTDSIKITVPKSVINWLITACDEDEKHRRQLIFATWVQKEIDYDLYKKRLKYFSGGITNEIHT